MKGSGYNFIHAADMMYCADNHIRSESEPPLASERPPGTGDSRGFASVSSSD